MVILHLKYKFWLLILIVEKHNLHKSKYKQERHDSGPHNFHLPPILTQVMKLNEKVCPIYMKTREEHS